MIARRLVTVSVSFALSAAALVVARADSQQRPQTRDTITVPTGNGAIAGRVVSDAPGNPPVRRVVVAVQLGGSPAGNRGAVTDDDGRFEVTGLAAGRYTVVASKPAWTTTYYGSRLPGRGPGTAIVVGAGERVTGLTVTLLRGAVIAGRLFDRNGKPVSNARVIAMTPRAFGGVTTYQMVLTSSGLLSQTDDTGAYRIFGLPPGDYIVGATAAIGAARETTAEEVQWAMASPAGPGVAPQRPPRASTMIYPPTYYPGVVDAAAAARVTLQPGEERSNLDFGVQFVAASEIEGTVLTPDGRPSAGSQVFLTSADGVNVSILESSSNRAVTRPDGRFIFAAVRPGRYVLMARASSQPTARPAPPTGRGGAPALDLWASADVVASGQDVSGLSLQLQPGMTIRGHVVLEATTLEVPADLSRVRLQLTSPDVQIGTARMSMHLSSANADGTFEINGVVPGTYVLLGNIPGGNASEGASWMLKSVKMGGQEAFDRPIEVRGGQDIDGVVMTFTDGPGEIGGLLTDAAGRPAPEFYVFAFPVDRSAWRPASQRMRPPTRPGSDGRFRIPLLQAGEYYLAALTSFEDGDVYDPAFLEQVAPSAIRVVIAEGEKKIQDIKLRSGGDSLAGGAR